ncbi:MAG: alkaline phosphatase family protein [Candidatus Thermoplasmatota archaeon]|nr:alkaline phosphatase family protein [Candidatus Thermoplasmatota archaeon]
MEKKDKVIVIGLDGATFNVISPLVERGELPTIKKVLENGASAHLASTIPPLSSTAWASFMTGMTPSNHGAYDFIIKKQGSYGSKFLNGTLIKAPAFWETLGSAGKKAIVQNVMGTYPPKPVNGYLITGFLSPPGAGYTYPATFQEEIEQRFGNYPRAPGTSVPPGGEREYIQQVFDNFKKRVDITHYLLDTKEWDLFVVVFEATDILQHAFWKYYAEPQRIGKDALFIQNAIPEIYRRFDVLLSQILEKIDKNTTLVVVSDHGFNCLHKVIFMNNLLMDMDLLTLKKRPSTQLKKLCLKYHLNAETLVTIGEKMGFKIKGAAIENKKGQQIANKLFLSQHDIDWKKTKAFSVGVGGHIYINLKEKESQGNVSFTEYRELKAFLTRMLENLKDPETGENIIKEVYQKEELYQGQYASSAPDLSILPHEGYFPLYKEHFISPSFLMKPSVSGGHTLHGVFIMYGKDVCKGVKIPQMNIWDVASIVCKIFHVDASHMDGKVPDGLFV